MPVTSSGWYGTWGWCGFRGQRQGERGGDEESIEEKGREKTEEYIKQPEHTNERLGATCTQSPETSERERKPKR